MAFLQGHDTVEPEDGLVSMWMPSPHQQPAVSLTFDLQNLIMSSVRLMNIPCKFHQAIHEISC